MAKKNSPFNDDDLMHREVADDLLETMNEEVVQLEDEIYELKQQLAEKDKEIEELRNEFIQEKEFLNKQYDRCDKARKKSVEELKEIRHEICEEIREKAQKENRYLLDHAKLQTIEGILYTISNYVLDQIEKGESK